MKALQNSSAITLRIASIVEQEPYDPSKLVEAAGCGDWVWRIGETGTDADACPDAIWISEILQGSATSTTKQQHDARANVSTQHGYVGLPLTSRLSYSVGRSSYLRRSRTTQA